MLGQTIVKQKKKKQKKDGMSNYCKDSGGVLKGTGVNRFSRTHGRDKGGGQDPQVTRRQRYLNVKDLKRNYTLVPYTSENTNPRR